MGKLLQAVLLAALLMGLKTEVMAQDFTVKGKVVDTSGVGLPGAVVRIYDNKDSSAVSTDPDGNFFFRNRSGNPFTLSAGYIGYSAFKGSFEFKRDKELSIPFIELKALSNTLDAVVISGTPPVKISEDTVSFNARAFPVREGDGVDEMLKRLPGIEVDKDGNVTSQGTPVTKIRVNGKDFFGTDVATAIKNLPADIIKNLQFIDDYGDQARLTGIKSGEPEKVLNLTIQEDKKKGYFVRAAAGVGNLERYNLNLRGNSIKGERQLSLDATLANANVRGGGGDGITTRNKLGLNYKNEFSKKLSADISYNFDNTKNSTISSTFTQSFLQDSLLNATSRIEDARSDNTTRNNRHALGGNLEYKIDTSNYLKISPNLSFERNSGNNFSTSLTSQDSLATDRLGSSLSNGESINLRTNIFYNHKFNKHGRSLTGWSNIAYSNDENSRTINNRYINIDNNIIDTLIQNQNNGQAGSNMQFNFGASYMEPLSKHDFVEINYSYNHSANKSSREVFDINQGAPIFNADLSNLYDYQFTTNRFGLNFRHVGEKLKYTIGLSAQPVTLKGENLSRNISTLNQTFNFIPSMRFSYKFSQQRSLELNYRGRSNQPSFLQLQPISDNSDLQNIVTGNPDLLPEFIHGVDMHYKQADWNAGKVVLANLRYERIDDRIVSTKKRLPGSVYQQTSFINTDGYYSLRGDYDISQPLLPGRKLSLGLSGSGQLNNNISFTDDTRIEAENFNWRQEVELRVDIENVVNLEAEASYSQNITHYSTDLFPERRTKRLEYGVEGRTFLFDDLTLGYDFTKQVNMGYDNGSVRNPTLLRLYTEYRFLKNNAAAVRVEGFDLFNQNAGISRDVFDNVIVDRQVNRLGRYFMFSLIFRVRNFGS
ncbi:outer membrane beta-barrel protein [Pedobacter sp. Leaf176]|uniref:outer membrane beta-barrel protein n=1 Tax=Pedobacter sp. Leaf176 TaxID=1736286 RepID=UPI000AE3DBD8|nr:outer membrane beta-barrel protein [Pedobacter sp. Leaf176]